MPPSRLLPRHHPAATTSLIDIVELSLEALAAELTGPPHDPVLRRLPSQWLAAVVAVHLDALRGALVTYRDARFVEQEDDLF